MPHFTGHQRMISSEIVGATLAVVPNTVSPDRRVTVGDIVGAYKSLVANACLKIYKSNHQTTGKLWQRNFGKIGKPYRENFHFSWEKVPFTILGGSGFLKLLVNTAQNIHHSKLIYAAKSGHQGKSTKTVANRFT